MSRRQAVGALLKGAGDRAHAVVCAGCLAEQAAVLNRLPYFKGSVATARSSHPPPLIMCMCMCSLATRDRAQLALSSPPLLTAIRPDTA